MKRTCSTVAPTGPENSLLSFSESMEHSSLMLSSCTVASLDPFSSHFRVYVLLRGNNRSLRTPAMIDSGATALFLSWKFVKKHHIIVQPLKREIRLNNIDGTANKAGQIIHLVRAQVVIEDHKVFLNLLIILLRDKDMMIRYIYLYTHNPKID